MTRVTRFSVPGATAVLLAVGLVWSAPAWSQEAMRGKGNFDDERGDNGRGHDDDDGDHGGGGGNGGGRNRCVGTCLGQFRDCLGSAHSTHRACVRACLALRGQIAQACHFSSDGSLEPCSQAIQAFQGCLSDCATNFTMTQRECVDSALTCLGGCNAPQATATSTAIEADTPTFTPTPAPADTATAAATETETPTATPTADTETPTPTEPPTAN